MTEVGLPAEITNMVATAEPSRQEDATATEQLRQEMLQTMQEMEAARVRVGDFCISIDTQADTTRNNPVGIEKAVLLATPADGTRDYGAGTINTRNYVFATAQGFKTIEFGVGMVDGSEPYYSIDGYQQEEQRLQALLKQTKDGKVEPKMSQGYQKRNATSPYHNEYLWISGDPQGFRVIDADIKLVTDAVQKSISKAQEPHKSDVAQAQNQMSTASAVKQELGNSQ